MKLKMKFPQGNDRWGLVSRGKEPALLPLVEDRFLPFASHPAMHNWEEEHYNKRSYFIWQIQYLLNRT